MSAESPKTGIIECEAGDAAASPSLSLSRSLDRYTGPMPFAPRSRRQIGRARATSALAVGVVVWGSVALTGCAAAPEPVDPPPTATTPAPVEQPVLHPDGTAGENLPLFTSTLQSYAKGNGRIEGRPIVDALGKAGFEQQHMQVSFDRTKTDLIADSIFVSVRFGHDCLVGQVLTDTRAVYAEQAAALGPKRNLCLIGDTRPIDW